MSEPLWSQCAPCCRRRPRRAWVHPQWRRGYILECFGCRATWLVVA